MSSATNTSALLDRVEIVWRYPLGGGFHPTDGSFEATVGGGDIHTFSLLHTPEVQGSMVPQLEEQNGKLAKDRLWTEVPWNCSRRLGSLLDERFCVDAPAFLYRDYPHLDFASIFREYILDAPVWITASCSASFISTISLPDTSVSSSDWISEWRHCQDPSNEDLDKPFENLEKGNSGRGDDGINILMGAYESEEQYKSDNIDYLVQRWSGHPQYELARTISTTGIDNEAYIGDPPIINMGVLYTRDPKTRRKIIRMDPDCAICHSPATLECDCEAKGLKVAVKNAEDKIMSPLYLKIRSWVRSHSQDFIQSDFKFRIETAKEGLKAEARSDEIHDTHNSGTRLSQQELSSIWSECISQCHEPLEYFYSLVKLELPADDEDVVRRPPLSELSVELPARQDLTPPESP
ncbi:hypothetical protein PG988_004593 [Apiospora saccharicola]